MLCATIITSLQQDPENLVLYYLCSYLSSEANNCLRILKSLAVQVLKSNPDLCAMVYDDFIDHNVTPSVVQLRKMLPILLSTAQSARIVVDGLDEFDDRDHKSILTELVALSSCNKSGGTCKVLIASQDVVKIARSLWTRSCLDLNKERAAIGGAIQAFVHSSVSELHLFSDVLLQQDIMSTIEQALVEKADGAPRIPLFNRGADNVTGMFLWVQLVLATLENVYSVSDMQKAVDTLPEGLDKVSARSQCVLLY